MPISSVPPTSARDSRSPRVTRSVASTSRAIGLVSDMLMPSASARDTRIAKVAKMLTSLRTSRFLESAPFTRCSISCPSNKNSKFRPSSAVWWAFSQAPSSNSLAAAWSPPWTSRSSSPVAS